MGKRNGKFGTMKSEMRSILMERFSMRGQHYSNIWIFYSAKTLQDWAVSSDLEFDFAMWLEGNPQVVRYDLNPPEVLVRVGDSNLKTRFDAIVRYADGRIEAVELKYASDQGKAEGPRVTQQRAAQTAAAQRDGMTYRRVTDVDLIPHEMAIVNWRRVLPFLAAVRSIEIGAEAELAAIALAAAPQGVTLGELLRSIEHKNRPSYLAAVFKLVQRGLYDAQLDSVPLSAQTRITATEVCA